MDKITYRAIGRVRSPFKQASGTPIQAALANDSRGSIELFPDFVEGLVGLEGFSHLMLFYHFHLSGKAELKVKPFLDEEEHGVFATRAPRRPNALGVSIVRLEKIEGNVLHIRNLDILDGTPLLDIKPYVPAFDKREDTRTGWLEDKNIKMDGRKDDGRFIKNEGEE